MKTQVGEMSGRGWKTLGEKEAVAVSRPQLLKLSLQGLSSSVEGFEGSHPNLVEIVNSICLALSNIGI